MHEEIRFIEFQILDGQLYPELDTLKNPTDKIEFFS